MKNFLKNMDRLHRRAFMERTAKSAFGVSLIPGLQSAVLGADKPKLKKSSVQGGKAKRLIYLFMTGAMTHLDTFDLKPGHENQGETKGIKTKIPGLQIGENLPGIAEQFDKIAAVRSMYTETAAHQPGRYLMQTSYKEIATTRHPTMGPWAQRHLGRQNKDLPDTVTIAGGAKHPGSGYLGPQFSPLPLGDPNRGLQNTVAPSYLTDSSFEKRLALINKFDRSFRKKFPVNKVNTYSNFYTQATRLLSSTEIEAFDLKKEDDKIRDEYGRSRFGQGCLLARRLIENNVRCVEVTFGGWDDHRDLYGRFPDRAATLDQGISALLKDLEEKGLLDETLIVLTTEFGRSPKINQNGGRDHHPAAFSAALMGGMVQGGQLYGKSDEEGRSVEEDGVSPADLNATIAKAMGLPLAEEIYSPTGRPFTVAHDGQPIDQLLS